MAMRPLGHDQAASHSNSESWPSSRLGQLVPRVDGMDGIEGGCSNGSHIRIRRNGKEEGAGEGGAETRLRLAPFPKHSLSPPT